VQTIVGPNDLVLFKSFWWHVHLDLIYNEIGNNIQKKVGRRRMVKSTFENASYSEQHEWMILELGVEK
jgi:hypothetical protein